MPNDSSHIQNIALIGFMGTGKSSVGQVVAGHLHFDFLDTDHLIETRVGKSISEIFAQDGEPVFRGLERELVKELATRQRTVISTGGGLPAEEGNLASLKTHALVVCLWASADRIWERVRHQAHRPLLNDPDPLGKIRQLLEAREPYYRQADVLVNTDLRSVREVAQQVLHHFQSVH
jgi:shikimate kinase